MSRIDPDGLMGRGSGAQGGRSTQVIWNGLGNTDVCSYYDEMASKNPTCSYYKDAANICRGRGLKGWLTSGVVRAGIIDTANSNGGRVYESTVLDSIRSALIEADKRNRQNGNTDSNGCVCGNAIDAYHNSAFGGAGLNPSYYGGNNWPQSLWPNPVPLDPSASPNDPRRLWQ